MTIDIFRGGRSLAVTLSPALDAWTGWTPFAPALHSGDVGWHLRFPDERLHDVFRVWRSGDATLAAGFVDAGALCLAIDPSWWASEELAGAIAEDLDGIDHVEAIAGTALRHRLLSEGWSVDPDTWVLLYRELTRADAALDDADTRPLAGPAEVAARTAVQRSAFSPGSTFTSDLWQTMSAGPSYDPRFEMVTWTPSGEPAAAATGWFAGPGRCALLEPVGTHQDHRGKGYGRRVNLAVMAALAGAGAAGIRVYTPLSNTAAVATYESCGLRQVDRTTALTRTGGSGHV